LWRRAPSLGKNVLSLGKCLNSLGNIFFDFLCNHSHFIFVFICYYNLSLEKFQGELQFCEWKCFNQNSYAKVIIKQNFEHICSPRKLQLLLKGCDCSQEKKGLICSSRQLKFLLFEDMIILWGKKSLNCSLGNLNSCLRTWLFFEEKKV
jgi:hypothetical protein